MGGANEQQIATAPDDAAAPEVQPENWGTEYDAESRSDYLDGVVDPGGTSPDAPDAPEVPEATPEAPEAPEAPDTEDAAEEGDWTPPTREEWEAMQQQADSLTDLLAPELEKMVEQQSAEPNTDEGTAQAEAPDAATVEGLLTPMEYRKPPDLDDGVLVKMLEDGDISGFKAYLQQGAEIAEYNRRAKEHNTALHINQAVLNGINYALPVTMAVSKFYERYPALMGVRGAVERAFWEARQQAPQANELQLLRAVEQRLGKPLIDKAKNIVAQHKGKGAKPRNMAPAQVGGGQPTNPRGRAAQVKPAVPDAETRGAELENWQQGL
jgi:hypothetical protein